MRTPIFLLHITICISLFFFCKKNDLAGSKPQVVIDSVKLSGFNTVVVFTSLKNYTGQPVDKGVCWSTATNPTIQVTKTQNQSTGFVFSDTLTGLLPATRYHIKSYLLANNGVVYSAEITVNTKAIGVVFDKMYAGTEESTYVVDVLGDEAKGFIICSYVLRRNGSGSFTRLTKMDANGNIVWTRDNNDGKWKEPFLIKQLPDGYLVGATYYLSGDIRLLLQKYDLNGNPLWERQFKKDALQSFIRMSVRDNDFLLTMKTLNGVSVDDPTYRISLWDFTIDKNGTITGETKYPNFTVLSNTSGSYHAIETPDGGFVGYCDSVYNVGCCGGDNDFEVERFGPQNKLKWKKTFGSLAFEYVVKGVAAPDGNYVITGVRYNELNTLKRACFIKVNGNDGSMVWEKYYGSENANSFTSVYDLIQYDNGYYATGVTNGSDIYILNLDNAGNKNWDYLIPAQNGYNIVVPQKVYVTANREIYIFGVKNNDQAKPAKLFMMKLKQ